MVDTAEFFEAFHAGMIAFEVTKSFDKAVEMNPYEAGSQRFHAFIKGVFQANELEQELQEEAELERLHEEFVEAMDTRLKG